MDDKDLIWQQIKDQLSKNSDFNDGPLSAGLNELYPESVTDSTLTITTKSIVIFNFMKKHYLGLIEDALNEISDIHRNVDFFLVGNQSPVYSEQQIYESTQAHSSYSQNNKTPSFDSHNYETQRILENERLQSSSYQRENNRSQFNYLNTEKSFNTHQVVNDYIHSTNQDFSQEYIPSRRYEETRIFPSTFSPRESLKTFDSFVVGDTNQLAYSVSLSVAENPGYQYNPLFLYGKSGLGKTHLLMAIKNFINQYNPSYKVVYAQTINFVNDYTTTLQTRQWDKFNDKYHNCDVLLLDDVQNLEGKKESTNEIFTIFNNMIEHGKQVVLSADRPPKKIDLDERFTSRFSLGIMADITPPTFETKLAIFKNCIRNQCELFGINEYKIPEEVCTRIVELSNSNIRSLEGAATTLVAQVKTRDESYVISLEEADRLVENIFSHPAKKNINIKMIQREVENYFHITHSDMIGTKRSHNITYPRQIAMYLSRMMIKDVSFPEIGRAFGGKNHTSVIYAVNSIEQKKQEDVQTKEDIEHLISVLEE